MAVVDEHPTRGKAVRSWLAWTALVLFSVVGLAMCAGLVALSVFIWQFRSAYFESQRSVERLVAEIRAAGEPVTVGDMYAIHRVREGAADITADWMQVWNSFDPEDLSAELESLPLVAEGRHKVLAHTLDDAQRDQVAALLTEYAPTIELAFQAAKLQGECRYPVRFEDGVAGEVPVASRGAKSLTLLLDTKLRVHVQDGEVNRAIDTFSTMRSASASQKKHPSMLGHTGRAYILTRALEDANWLVNQTLLDDEQLACLQTEIEAIDFEDELTFALLGERQMDYQMFLSFRPPPVIELTEGDTTGRLTGQPHDCELLLEFLNRMVSASRLPAADAYAKAKNLSDELTRRRGSWTEIEAKQRSQSPSSISLDLVGFELASRIAALRDAVRVAVAAERFRRATGEFPPSIAEMVPQYLESVPSDSFNGEPLRGHASPEEFVAYSVGFNLRDDGGHEKETESMIDIVARVYAEKGPRTPDSSLPVE
jgi:hypothetical protein